MGSEGTNGAGDEADSETDRSPCPECGIGGELIDEDGRWGCPACEATWRDGDAA